MGKERAIVMEKLSNDDNGGGGSCGWRQQPWRKLRTAAAMVVKVANGGVVGGGSFKCVRRWRRKLWSYLLVMEGVVHGSSSSGGNCAQKLDLRTCLSAAKEALDMCVGSGGSSGSRGEPRQRSSVYGLGSSARVPFKSLKGEGLVPPAVFDLLMRMTFPAPTALVKATERFRAIYPTPKELVLLGLKLGNKHHSSFCPLLF